MLVVLDANMYVSAAIHTGPSHRIVQRAISSHDFDVVMCPALRGEIADVLRRPRLRKRIDPDAAKRFLENITALINMASDPEDVVPITHDPSDVYLVALAHEHNADYLVTGDKDLLEWDGQRPPVISPAELEIRHFLESDTQE